MSATENGPAPKETISHAAPTLCMKAPTSERTFAMSRCRKIGTRNGRHKVCDAGMDSTSPTAPCGGNPGIIAGQASVGYTVEPYQLYQGGDFHGEEQAEGRLPRRLPHAAHRGAGAERGCAQADGFETGCGSDVRCAGGQGPGEDGRAEDDGRHDEGRLAGQTAPGPRQTGRQLGPRGEGLDEARGATAGDQGHRGAHHDPWRSRPLGEGDRRPDGSRYGPLRGLRIERLRQRLRQILGYLE